MVAGTCLGDRSQSPAALPGGADWTLVAVNANAKAAKAAVLQRIKISVMDVIFRWAAGPIYSP